MPILPHICEAIKRLNDAEELGVSKKQFYVRVDVDAARMFSFTLEVHLRGVEPLERHTYNAAQRYEKVFGGRPSGAGPME